MPVAPCLPVVGKCGVVDFAFVLISNYRVEGHGITSYPAPQSA